MNNCIVGADACNGKLVCTVLNAPLKPDEIGKFYRDKSNFFDLPVTTVGLEYLLSLNPSVIVIEPTGVNYIKFWIAKCSEFNISIALVGHTRSNRYRDNLGLPDKDDQADALALGLYYWEHKDSPLRFVRLRDGITSQLRDTALRIKHCDRVQSPLINKLQQDLTWALPEVKGSVNAVLFWRWLAGNAKSQKYDRLTETTCGLGVTRNMRAMAYLLSQLWIERSMLEKEMLILLDNPQFDRERQVMDKYHFPLILQAFLISQYYPISNFLGDDGKPIVEISINPQTNTRTIKPISMRRFRKALGVAPVRESSGKSSTITKISGSKVCRVNLWLWVF